MPGHTSNLDSFIYVVIHANSVFRHMVLGLFANAMVKVQRCRTWINYSHSPFFGLNSRVMSHGNELEQTQRQAQGTRHTTCTSLPNGCVSFEIPISISARVFFRCVALSPSVTWCGYVLFEYEVERFTAANFIKIKRCHWHLPFRSVEIIATAVACLIALTGGGREPQTLVFCVAKICRAKHCECTQDVEREVSKWNTYMYSVIHSFIHLFHFICAVADYSEDSD